MAPIFQNNPAWASDIPSRRWSRVLVLIALQAMVWIAIAIAFAAFIHMAGWARWLDALHFSALNWLPWIAIAPVVFRLARRFPLERGRLLHSVPLHAFACIACSVLIIWISAQFARHPWPGLGGRGMASADARSFDSARRDGWNRSPLPSPPPIQAAETTGTPAKDQAGSSQNPRVSARATEQPRTRRPDTRPSIAYNENARGEGERAAPPVRFRTRSAPGSESHSGILRRWVFLGGIWPPFSATLLRANFSIAVYMIIAAVAHAFAYHRHAQERERQALALAAGLNQAKLDALRIQLQPHFLFNTLNAISALVHRNPEAADELIADLSELLRLSLQCPDNEVPLSRELELLDCYLAIERTRLGERLQIQREVDSTVSAVLVPTFILQPLAENAVRHGIEPRRGPGTVAISARRDGDQLRLVVADDGVGLKTPDRRSSHRGIGLANARERLRTLHGDKAQLHVIAPENGGLRIEILLPFREATKASLHSA